MAKQTPRDRAIKKIEAMIKKWMDRHVVVMESDAYKMNLSNASYEIYDYTKLHHQRNKRNENKLTHTEGYFGKKKSKKK